MRASELLESPLQWLHNLSSGAAPEPSSRTPVLPIPRRHAEVFTSERTGEWIRVSCDCGIGTDHWHARA